MHLSGQNNSSCGQIAELRCNQEDAKTRILLHASIAVNQRANGVRDDLNCTCFRKEQPSTLGQLVATQRFAGIRI